MVLSCSSVPAQVSLHRHEEARALLLLRFDEINQAGVADLLADPYAKSTQMVERRLRRAAERAKLPNFHEDKGRSPETDNVCGGPLVLVIGRPVLDRRTEAAALAKTEVLSLNGGTRKRLKNGGSIGRDETEALPSNR